MFVTSTTIAVENIWQDLSGADRFCQDLAGAAGLPVQQYKAWLSTSSMPAADRLDADLGWVRPDGEVFALSKMDLLAGRVLAPPSIDEWQTMWTTLTPVFTGTQPDGTAGTNCEDWTSTTVQALVGTANGGTGSWTHNTNINCNQASRIYCLGDSLDAAQVSAPSTDWRRLAFVSEGSFTADSGIQTAHDLCQAEAAAAGLTGTFKALLATSASTSLSQFASGSDWVRLDGARVLLGDTASAGVGFLAPLNLTPPGNYLDRNIAVWSGGNLTTVVASSDVCNDWSSASGFSLAGRPDLSGEQSTAAFNRNCDTGGMRVYCFEE